MIFINPETNTTFFSDIAENGLVVRSNGEWVAYECINKKLVMTYIVATNFLKPGFVRVPPVIYAIEVDKNNHLVPYFDTATDLMGFKVAKILLKNNTAIFTEMIDYGNQLFHFQTTNHSKEEIRDAVKEMLYALGQKFPECVLADVVEGYLNHDSFWSAQDCLTIMQTHIKIFQKDIKYRQLIKNGFGCVAFCGEPWDENNLEEVHLLYNKLYNRKMQEIGEEGKRIILKYPKWRLNNLNLFFNYGFGAATYNIFMRIFHSATDASIEKYQNCKKYIDPHEQMTTNEIMNELEKLVIYLDADGHKKRATATQLLDILDSLSQFCSADDIANVCRRTSNFISLKIYVGDTKARLFAKRVQNFDEKLKKLTLETSKSIMEIDLPEGDIFTVTNLNKIDGCDKNIQEKILSAFEEKYKKYDVLIEIQDWNLDMVAIMLVNVKSGFNETIYPEENISDDEMKKRKENVAEIKNICFKKLHKEFLMRNVL